MAGEYVLSVLAEGCGSISHRVEVSPGGSTDVGRVVLAEAASLTVQLGGHERNTPVTFEVLDEDLQEWKRVFIANSGADGSCVLRRCSSGAYRVSAAGHESLGPVHLDAGVSVSVSLPLCRSVDVMVVGCPDPSLDLRAHCGDDRIVLLRGAAWGMQTIRVPCGNDAAWIEVVDSTGNSLGGVEFTPASRDRMVEIPVGCGALDVSLPGWPAGSVVVVTSSDGVHVERVSTDPSASVTVERVSGELSISVSDGVTTRRESVTVGASSASVCIPYGQ